MIRICRKVVLVNETAAKRLWPGKDPIGRAILNIDNRPDDTVCWSSASSATCTISDL